MTPMRSFHQDLPHEALQVLPLGPLTFVYYTESLGADEDLVCAHCLELDLGGQGATKEEATEDLQEAVEVYLEHHISEGIAPSPSDPPQELVDIEDRRVYHMVLVQAHPPKPLTPDPTVHDLGGKRNSEVFFTDPQPLFDPSKLAAC